MEPDRPSRTAFRVAMRRAAHQVLDQPLVLEDKIALRIIGPRRAESIQADAKRYDTGFGRALRLFLVARSRCAEDALARAVAAGVRQYVVLGAGLDTFAYRNPFPPEQLRVFEVDMPATQAFKRDLLSRTRIDVPASVTFVPVDFERQGLAEQLRAAGLREDQPVFFSWLGVSMYLTRDAIMATLGYVGRFPPGSGITFDYMLPPHRLPWFRRIGFWLVARRVAKLGEPWKTWFEPAELASALHALGLDALEELDGPGLNQRYFGGREKRLGGASVGRVMTALVSADVARPTR
jgi:methyltransferase (TIGR00027 family)